MDRGVERVACACEAAAAAGVRCGMTVAHARSLLAGRRVRTAQHNPEAVHRALDRLVQWAFRFSPVVSPDYPDGLLLDITGCAHLYAGEEKLAQQIVWALEQWRFPARVCVAPTAAAARAVVRHACERITVIPDHAAGDELRFLPVPSLGIEPDICALLAEVGVMNVDQLLNLPREDLAVRFGADLLAKIDRALGLARELVTPARQIEPVEFTRAFDGAVRNQEAVFPAVEQLLREMIARLALHESGVCRMTLTFHRIDQSDEATKPRSHEEMRHEGTEARRHEVRPAKHRRAIFDASQPDDETGPIPRSPLHHIAPSITSFRPDISLSLSFPSRDLRHLGTLLRPKLEGVNLGYGVEEIVLRVLHAQRLPHLQMELWPDAASPTHVDEAVLGQWLDQVLERLGRHAVVRMEPAQRYLPEEAFAPTVIDKVHSAEPRSHAAPKPRREKQSKNSSTHHQTYPAARPSNLYSPPEHALVIALVPDGPPAWISWRDGEAKVVCGYGPERIAGPWWNHDRHEGTEARRHEVGQQGSKTTRQPGNRTKASPSPHHPITTSPHHEVRDYFVIQTGQGIWLWVFRDQDGEWFVHGEWS